MWSQSIAPALDGFHVLGETPELRLAAQSAGARVLLDRIVAGWPVDTGRSLAGFKTQRVASGWFVLNAVEYTQHVHNHPNQGGPPPLIDRLVARAWPVVVMVVRRELQRVVARSRVVGAGGNFQLRARRGPLSTPPPPGTAAVAEPSPLAVRRAMRVVVALRGELRAPIGLEAVIQAGAIATAAQMLRRSGFEAEAAELDQLGRAA